MRKIFSKIREKIYKYNLKLNGVKFGENIKFTYPFPGISKPYETLELGNNILISGNVKFITHDGASYVVRNLEPELKKYSTVRSIKVGNNVFIGNEVMILAGVTIGDNVIIGARSVVTKNCDSNSVYAGIPAKKICSLNNYIEKYKVKYGDNND